MDQKTFKCDCCGQTFSQYKKYSAILKTDEFIEIPPQSQIESVYEADTRALALYCEDCSTNYFDLELLIQLTKNVTYLMRIRMKNKKAIKPTKEIMNKNFYLN